MRMNDINISEHFKLYEFESPDTNEVKIDPELVQKLEILRKLVSDYLGKDTPLIINSGYRTWEHHKYIYEVELGYGDKWEEHISTKSKHLYGIASDIKKVPRLSINQLANLAEDAGFDGIGKYSWGIHVDTRGYRARW